MDGDTAVVGAFYDDTPAGTDAGSAYVFVRSGSTWTEQVHLTAPDAAVGDHFGTSVALDAGTAVIGAGDADAAYVVVRSGSSWIQQAELIGTTGDFGRAVAVTADTALVGAPYDNVALVFVRSGSVWTQQAELIPSDGNSNDGFGGSVALDEDTALVGAQYDNTEVGIRAGSAYVFVRFGHDWVQQAKLRDTEGGILEFFGNAVAVNGDIALIGAIWDDPVGQFNAGSALVYERVGARWHNRAKVTAPDGDNDDGFGSSVALDGDVAVVGAALDDTHAGADAGSAWAFWQS